MTYGPGFDGSPNNVAVSFVPASLRTNLMSLGATNVTAAGSMSALENAGTVNVTIPRAAVKRRARPFMVRPCIRVDVGRLMLGLSISSGERTHHDVVAIGITKRELARPSGGIHPGLLIELVDEASRARQRLVEIVDPEEQQ